MPLPSLSSLLDVTTTLQSHRNHKYFKCADFHPSEGLAAAVPALDELELEDCGILNRLRQFVQIPFVRLEEVALLTRIAVPSAFPSPRSSQNEEKSTRHNTAVWVPQRK